VSGKRKKLAKEIKSGDEDEDAVDKEKVLVEELAKVKDISRENALVQTFTGKK
jgi:hypothetical protein